MQATQELGTELARNNTSNANSRHLRLLLNALCTVAKERTVEAAVCRRLHGHGWGLSFVDTAATRTLRLFYRQIVL